MDSRVVLSTLLVAVAAVAYGFSRRVGVVLLSASKLSFVICCAADMNVSPPQRGLLRPVSYPALPLLLPVTYSVSVTHFSLSPRLEVLLLVFKDAT